MEFESLNDKLSDTGYSVANYIQPALPGSGYAWPRLKLLPKHEIPLVQRPGYQANPNLILNKKRPEARYHSTIRGIKYYVVVVIDEQRVIDIGVWGCQIRIDNTAIVHSVRLMGYPIPFDGKVYQDPERPGVYNQGYVFAPRPLFPKYFLPNVTHPLNTHLKAEDIYYLVVGIQPVIDFYRAPSPLGTEKKTRKVLTMNQFNLVLKAILELIIIYLLKVGLN